MRFKVDILHLPCKFGGRPSPIPTEYRTTCRFLEGGHNSCRIILKKPIAPGETGEGNIQPLVERYWCSIILNDQILIHEGHRVVAIARVTRVDDI